MKIVCAVLSCALAATAQAQVFKCRDAAGNTVYQSNGCQYTEQPVSQAAPATPARSSKAASAATPPRKAKVQPDDRNDVPAAGYYYNSTARGGKSPNFRSVGACSASKAQRRDAFEKMGPSRSESATRFYDDAVKRACGGA